MKRQQTATGDGYGTGISDLGVRNMGGSGGGGVSGPGASSKMQVSIFRLADRPKHYDAREPYYGHGGGIENGFTKHDLDHPHIDPHAFASGDVGLTRYVAHPAYPAGSRGVSSGHLQGTAGHAGNGSPANLRSFPSRSGHQVGKRSPAKGGHCFNGCRSRQGR